ncbi:MAG TPA: CAP domain-containing protein [Candidatus Angelobacter sp.]|nr:CAP domain-containing protein [Candidatus Angelobacter sp.]
MFYLLNLERKQAGLSALDWNDDAAQAARAHAQLLADHGELSHQFPGEPGLAQRLITTSVRFASAAENIALADDEDEAHLALMGSPGHRENILTTYYTAVGIGVARRNGRLFVTEDFVRLIPKYSEQRFQNAFAKAVNDARHVKHMRPVLITRDMSLRRMACATRGEAPSAKPVGLNVTGELIVFNLSDPQQLPLQLLQRISGPSLNKVRVGVCFRPDAEHGNGNFWVVALLQQ